MKSQDLILACFYVFLAFYAGTNVFSPVRFDREKIEIDVTGAEIHVQGLYHYQNRLPLPVTFSLGLPFPVDTAHPAPASYSVTEIASDGSSIREILTRKYHGDVVFRLFFWPRREKWIRVDYLQQAALPNGRYILLTTRKWDRPLERGEYVLRLGDPSELAGSNYSLRKSLDGAVMRYSFEKENFLPSEDWVFSWRAAAPLIASRRDPR